MDDKFDSIFEAIPITLRTLLMDRNLDEKIAYIEAHNPNVLQYIIKGEQGVIFLDPADILYVFHSGKLYSCERVPLDSKIDLSEASAALFIFSMNTPNITRVTHILDELIQKYPNSQILYGIDCTENIEGIDVFLFKKE